MIQLQTLAKKINTDLADATVITERGDYKFFVVADTADYKRAEREGNKVTVFINGNLILTSSNVESTQAGSVNATIGTRLDLLVPVLDGNDEDGNKQLVEDVRAILDDYFSTNGEGNISDGTKTFYYGYQYNIAVSGARAMLPEVGDSFLFSIDISYYFIENGVSSKAIRLIIGDEVVDYLTLGISRNTTQESDTPSDTRNGAAKNVNLATVLAIHVTMPMILSNYMNSVVDYALGNRSIGENLEVGKIFSVFLEMPRYPESQSGSDTARGMYNMVLSDAKINSEGALNASVSFTLTEAM